MKASEILDLAEGSLSQVTFPRILNALLTGRRTAVLRVSHHGILKKIVFEDGLPVDCRSNLVHETLSRYLVQQGKITREQEAQLLARAANEGMLFGEVAREQEILTVEELFKLLQQNLAKKLLDLFSWEEGTFRFVFDVPVVESVLKVNVPQLILTGCTRFVPKKQVELEIAPVMGRRLALHPQPAVDLSELRLIPQQRQLLETLDEARSVREITQAAGSTIEETSRFLYALLVMDLLVEEEELEALRPAQPEPESFLDLEPEPQSEPPPASIGIAPEAAKVDAAAVASDVMTVYLRHRRVDALGLFGLPPGATDQMIRESFVHFCERFAPWSFEHPELLSLKDKAEELFFAGVNAFSSLVDKDRRELVAPKQPADDLQIVTRTADELAIEEELLDPEEYFHKGRQLMEHGHFHRAVREFEQAVECDPQNGVYRAEAAWALYQSSPGIASAEPLEALRDAMRIDPTCGLTLYYYGLMLRDAGRRDQAKGYLQRAIKLMAPDPRPLEALRDLTRGPRR